MSIQKVEPGDVETFTVVTNPFRTYSSSSLGPTGSLYVFPRRSLTEKDTSSSPSFIDSVHTDDQVDGLLKSAKNNFNTDKFSGSLTAYLNRVNESAPSGKNFEVLNVWRFTPSVTFSDRTLKKLVVKDTLSPYYRTSYPSANWAYTNYNSLNFFTASSVPTSSVLLYPNVSRLTNDGYVSGTYALTGAFSFDFYINPRYHQDTRDGIFSAGTVFHLSSSYALSLVSGSAKDENGKTVGYRLLLQLSHSADVPPNKITYSVSNTPSSPAGFAPADLAFLSDDNALVHNNWHHVVVRWGTDSYSEGSGSFFIDGVDKGTFVIPSGTVAPRSTDGLANPDVLCVGNYYEGKNTGTSAQAYFFANDPAERDGLERLIDDVGGIDEPVHYAFNHPLNAELHDLSIRTRYMNDLEIATSSSMTLSALGDDVVFYVPPFFVEDSPIRRFVGDHGGILQTPFFEVDGTTNDPFNVAMSFGVAGHYVNIENFLKDFANNAFPRVHHMTGTALTQSTQALQANDFLYDQPFVRRRNLLVMPCDDGNFFPSYTLIASSSSTYSHAVDDLGNVDLSLVNLDNLLSTASLLFTVEDASGTFSYESIGFSPENPQGSPGNAYLRYVDNINKSFNSGTFEPGVQENAPLVVYQRTRDPSSNQVTFFDVSNLFYGKRIKPGTLVISDSSLTGSNGAMGVTLRDNGLGTLYRADCVTKPAKWNSVGTVFYNEGIIAIKSPHLYFFGKDSFDIEFRGEQSVHVLSFDVLANRNTLNSSSNPNYVRVPASAYPNDPDKDFVYITGLNFHDDNLNVVMKTQLAQPVLKRTGDRLRFKVRLDW